MIEMENAQMRADLELQNSNPDATTEMTVEWGTQIGGGGVDAPIETISQNGTQLPISNKNVNIDAYTTSQVDTKISEINSALSSQADAIQDNASDITSLKSRMSTAEGKITSLENGVEGHTTAIEVINDNISDIEDDIEEIESTVANQGTKVGNHDIAITTLKINVQNLGSRITTAESKLATYSIENFTVRYNPKFDTIHRPAGDRAPLLLNRSKIETVGGKRFFNIDIIYNNYIPGTSTFQGFEQDDVLFLLPRSASSDYADYSSLLSDSHTPYHSKAELFAAGQFFVVGWINRISAMNYNTGTSNSIMCQINKLGEVINNTTSFFKSTTSTQDAVYHITGRYEIANDWNIEEYENYVFQIS